VTGYQRTRRHPTRQAEVEQCNGAVFMPVLPGLTACARCAALLLNTDPARQAHSRFHDGLAGYGRRNDERVPTSRRWRKW
jgi:hypothetical protein